MPELVVQIKADLTNYTNGMKQAGVVTSTAANSMTGKLNDVTKAQTALNASQKAAEQAFNNAQVSIVNLTDKLARYKDLSANAVDKTKLIEYNRTIQQTEAEITRLGNVGKTGFDELGNAVAKGTNYLTKGFSAIRQLAYILPGVGIAGILAFATGPIIEYISKLELFKGKVTESTESQRELNKALSGDEYSKAVKSVYELTENIKLAKEGFISKKEALKEYNDTLGKTIGHANNLNQAEKLLIEHGDAYIRMTLLKATAQLALADASKAAYEEEQKREKKASEFGNVVSFGAGASSAPGFVPGANAVQLRKQRLDAEQANKDASIKISEDEKNQKLNIFKSFEEQAAKIAKENKFDFFGGKETDEAKALGSFDLLKKKVDELKKALENDVVSGAAPSVIKQAAIDLAIATDKLAKFERKIKEAQKLPAIGTSISSPTGTVKDSVNALQPPALVSRALPNFSKAITDLRDYTDGLTFAVAQEQILTDEQKKANAQYQTASRIANEMGGVFNHAFESMISGSQSAGQAIIQALESIIIKFIEAIAEAAILAALLTFTGLGALTGAASGIGAFGTNFASSLHLADGGITTGPTRALIGEGREKEAVMPLSKLQNFVNNNGGNVFIADNRLRGADLITQFQRAQIQKGRIG